MPSAKLSVAPTLQTATLLIRDPIAAARVQPYGCSWVGILEENTCPTTRIIWLRTSTREWTVAANMLEDPVCMYARSFPVAIRTFLSPNSLRNDGDGQNFVIPAMRGQASNWSAQIRSFPDFTTPFMQNLTVPGPPFPSNRPWWDGWRHDAQTGVWFSSKTLNPYL